MLSKTFAMIEGVRPGDFVPDETPCFDRDEIQQLGELLKRLLYAPSQVRRELQRCGVSVVPSNFYSEVPTIDEIEDSFQGESNLYLSKIFNESILRSTLSELSEFVPEFNPPTKSEHEGDFYWENSAFSFSDALSYYCMLRLKKPKSIVEIGSGFSTLIARMAVARNGFGQVICVEPYPPAFLRKLDVELVETKVQHLNADFFNERLTSDGDVLFVDSTHTVKHGSDCLKIYLDIIPNLQRGIHVHAHDIFLPKPMFLTFLRDKQVYWTEQYLLYAYLLENERTQVIYGSSYASVALPQDLNRFMAGKYTAGGGSLWFFQDQRRAGR